MEFLSEHWGSIGSIASVIGVVISLGGLYWAISEARGARSAAQAAEEATKETREEIGRHLVVVDLERAVALIQRLKLLHRESRWEAALEQYQALRAMTSSVIASYTDMEPARRERLVSAQASISAMESHVASRINGGLGVNDKSRLNQDLNEMQSDLEDMASTMRLGEQTGGN